jgi:hypothetical protein
VESSQLLFYLLVVAAIVGFNLLMRRMNSRARSWQEKLEQRQRDQAIGTESPDAWAEAAARSPWGGAAREQADAEPIEVVLARRARAVVQIGLDTRDEPDSAPPLRPVTTQRRRVQPMFRSQADLRQAVVFLTVLGPCRASAPFGRDTPEGLARPRARRQAMPSDTGAARSGALPGA